MGVLVPPPKPEAGDGALYSLQNVRLQIWPLIITLIIIMYKWQSLMLKGATEIAIFHGSKEKCRNCKLWNDTCHGHLNNITFFFPNRKIEAQKMYIISQGHTAIFK